MFLGLPFVSRSASVSFIATVAAIPQVPSVPVVPSVAVVPFVAVVSSVAVIPPVPHVPSVSPGSRFHQLCRGWHSCAERKDPPGHRPGSRVATLARSCARVFPRD
ncbi:hypothetical protein VFPFJ_06221 [Purpureocillium lilacinum]|uniref:Uncharacterized protein n=1 Tax=Purpureocillium lilacinum TaxID=33203 RepID=A0A179HHX1_PURLI|nr:hypothetical protein VFPFJ_06221 [Purpureocillium lilacinum]OAQ89807.1 hypothetical protein VFPFJ_06221 [Purpureocillium lilacinum]